MWKDVGKKWKCNVTKKMGGGHESDHDSSLNDESESSAGPVKCHRPVKSTAIVNSDEDDTT